MKFMIVEIPVTCENCPFRSTLPSSGDVPTIITPMCGLKKKVLKSFSGPRLDTCPRVEMPILVVPPGMWKDVELVRKGK